MNLINLKNKQEYEQIVEKVQKKMAYLCIRNHEKIPYTLTEDGSYNNMDFVNPSSDWGISWWTNGFFAGILWQMYYVTKEECYLNWAREQEKKLDPCFSIFEGLHHDVGFMWLASAAADYMQTESHEAKVRALHAATILAGRFNLNGNFIRAWNGANGEDRNSVIIDSLMNMSLLHWAYEETKDARFQAIAIAHTDTIVKNFVREDGSVKHIVRFDSDTGEVMNEPGGQGVGPGSAWTRGQSWAIYGLTNAYKHTKKQEYLDKAKLVADYFAAHLREADMVPVDFCQSMDDYYEDNSAACIAANGFLQLSEWLGEEGEYYRNVAIRLLERVLNYGCCLDERKEAVVMHCAVSYNEREHGYHTLIYADYFFLEAILALGNNALNIW